ncbi:MAG: glycosyltransferase [Actinomycetota bacterium]|nr:glycosyltransferase [Actinomycetota bacterium]
MQGAPAPRTTPDAPVAPVAPSAPVPTVAVVLATRGRPHLLAGLADAILADPGATELVVVVDGEPDAPDGGPSASLATLTALAATRPRLTAVAIPHAGHLRALEIGVARATAEVVLLLDDDVVPTCNLATGHARRHADRHGLVVVGSMPVALPAGRPGAGTLLYASDYDRHLANLRSGRYAVLDHLWMGNVSLRRLDAERVGLGDTTFRASYHTDRELGLRLAAAGLVGLLDEDLAAVHLHRRSTAAFLNDARRHGAGLAALHDVHGQQLGPFDPATVLHGLPSVLRTVLAEVGASDAALPIARTVAIVGEGLGRLGLSGAARGCAQLARRTMVCHGALHGERPAD